MPLWWTKIAQLIGQTDVVITVNNVMYAPAPRGPHPCRAELNKASYSLFAHNLIYVSIRLQLAIIGFRPHLVPNGPIPPQRKSVVIWQTHSQLPHVHKDLCGRSGGNILQCNVRREGVSCKRFRKSTLQIFNMLNWCTSLMRFVSNFIGNTFHRNTTTHKPTPVHAQVESALYVGILLKQSSNHMMHCHRKPPLRPA